MSATAPRSMERLVAVIDFPTHGVTLSKLLRRLASAAPRTIFSLFNTAKGNITAHPHRIPNLRVYDVADAVTEELEHSATPMERIDMFMKASPGNFREAIQAAEAEIGKKINCLISDAFLWFVADINHEFRVPWVAITTAPLFSLSVHLYINAIRKAFGVGATK